MQPRQPPDSTPLTQHDLTQLQFPFFQAPRTPNWHSNFKKKFISTTFTPLLRALKCHITPTGLVISGYVSIYVTLPSQPNQYAAFLAHSLKATSIPNYLNIIGILHKEFNLPYPLLENWPLQSLLTDCLGLSGSKVCPRVQKQPITPSILGHIYLHLNMHSSFDASFRAICWVIILVCFARAISLLNLHIPLMPPSNSYVRILLSVVVWLVLGCI